MFYSAIIIFLINMVIAYLAGYYLGIESKFDSGKGGLNNLTRSQILTIAGVGLSILIPLIGGTFFLLRWGFTKLYGRYLIYLNDTLQELDDKENAG
jgi:hypothetical protein